jgi:hypothetical protein
MKWILAAVHERIKPGNISQKYWLLFYVFETFFWTAVLPVFKIDTVFFFYQLLIVTIMLNIVLICDRMLLFKTHFTPNSIDTN